MTITATVTVAVGEVSASTTVTLDVEDPAAGFRWFGREQQPAAIEEGG